MRKMIIVLVVLLAISGCGEGPSYQAPEINVEQGQGWA